MTFPSRAHLLGSLTLSRPRVRYPLESRGRFGSRPQSRRRAATDKNRVSYTRDIAFGPRAAVRMCAHACVDTHRGIMLCTQGSLIAGARADRFVAPPHNLCATRKYMYCSCELRLYRSYILAANAFSHIRNAIKTSNGSAHLFSTLSACPVDSLLAKCRTRGKDRRFWHKMDSKILTNFSKTIYDG